MPDVLDGLDQQINAGMEPSSPSNIQHDYFGFSSTERCMLPDGVSYVELQVLNEGHRRKYTNDSNREIKLAKGSGDAALRMKPGDDKHSLLKISIVGWNLSRGGVPVPFNAQMLDHFLNSADPAVIDRIEKRIRQINPWLLSEMTVEQIDEEIQSLQEMREVRLREDEGKVTSSSK